MKKLVSTLALCLLALLAWQPAATAEVTTDPAQMDEYFTFDQGFRRAACDPDVLVLYPMLNHDKTLTMSSAILARHAEKIASFLGGECTLPNTAELSLMALLERDLTEYGTVFLCTHGATLNREDENGIVSLLMYASDDEGDAASYWQTVLSSGLVDPDRCLDWRGHEGSLQDALLQDSRPYLILREADNQLFGSGISLLGSHFEIILTTDYFIDRYADATFPNTLFYFCACESFGDYLLEQFLMNHGAAAFIGHIQPRNIIINMLTNSLNAFMGNLLSEDANYHNGIYWQTKSLREANIAVQWPDGSKSTFVDIFDPYNWGGFCYAGEGVVRGRVTEMTGEGVPGARVHAWRYWNGHMREESVVTANIDGSFEFPSLSFGSYLLQAEDGRREFIYQISFAEAEYNYAFLSLDPVEDGRDGSWDENFEAPEEGYDEDWDEEEDFEYYDGLVERGPEALGEYLGDWTRVDEDYCTLRLEQRADGNYWLSAAFYRIAAFEAEYVGVDEAGFLIFHSPDDQFDCGLALYSGWMSLYVRSEDEFGGYFDEPEFIYMPLSEQSGDQSLEDTAWINWQVSHPKHGMALLFHDGTVTVYDGASGSCFDATYHYDGNGNMETDPENVGLSAQVDETHMDVFWWGDFYAHLDLAGRQEADEYISDMGL